MTGWQVSNNSNIAIKVPIICKSNNIVHCKCTNDLIKQLNYFYVQYIFV